MYILGIDPSGDGTSGFCLMNSDCEIILIKELHRKRFAKTEMYWDYHIKFIERIIKTCKNNIIVAIEDFILNPKKANRFVGNEMNTSRLLGIIQHYCFNSTDCLIKIVKPAVCQSSISDEYLSTNKIIVKSKRGYDTPYGSVISNHVKDAIRIAVYVNKDINKGV